MNDVVVSVGTAPQGGSERSAFDVEPRQSTDVKYLALLLCLAAVATDFLGVSIVVPVLPFYALTFGATPDELGYMYSAFAGAQLLSTQWMSRLSDRKGRRVAFLTSFMGSVVGFFIQGLAWNVGSLLAARFLAGLFSGSAPVAMAYISDVCTPQERPKWMASLSAVMAASFFIGPAVGAGLAEFGLTVPMFASSGVSLVGLLLAFKYLKEPVVLLGAKQVRELKRINTLDLERDSDASTDSSGSESSDDDDTVNSSSRNPRPLSTPARDDGAGAALRFNRRGSSRLGAASFDAGTGGDSVRAVRASSVAGHTSVRSDDVSVAAIRLDDLTDGGGSVTANPGATSLSVRSSVDATDAASAPIAPEVNSVTATHGAESVRTGLGTAASSAASASSRGRVSRSDVGDDDTFSAGDPDAGRLATRGTSARTPFSISDRAPNPLDGPHMFDADGDVRSIAATRGSRRAERGLGPLRLRTSDGQLTPVGMMRVENLEIRSGRQRSSGSGRSKTSTRPHHHRKPSVLLVVGSAVVIFCNNMAFTGLQLLLPLYFEKLYGYTSLQLGYIFMATSVVLIVTQILEFNLVQQRIGLLPTAMIGGALHAAGHFCMTLADPEASYGRTVSLAINMGVLAVMVNGMALVTPAMPSFLASQASRKDMGKTLAYGGLASSAARMLGPLVLTPMYTVGPSEGFAAAGAFAGFQVLVLIVMRVWCRPTKLVRAPLTPRRHKEAKHSRDEWLDKLRDKIKVMLESRNYELKYRRSRAAVEKMIDRAIPHLAPSGDQRMKDINDLVRSLGEPPVFRAVPCTPPAFA